MSESKRMTLHPSQPRPELEAMLKRAKESVTRKAYVDMTQEEKYAYDALLNRQGLSMARTYAETGELVIRRDQLASTGEGRCVSLAVDEVLRQLDTKADRAFVTDTEPHGHVKMYVQGEIDVTLIVQAALLGVEKDSPVGRLIQEANKNE